MKLYTDFSYPTEIQDVVKLFYGEVPLVAQSEADLCVTETSNGDEFTYTATCGMSHVERVSVAGAQALQAIRLKKRAAKLAVYNLLVQLTGRQMPWGSLTGIRPTKLAVQLSSEGLDWQREFTEVLGVSRRKTQLVADILREQGDLRAARDGADLYVGIPFCVTRCSYCSFTSGEIERLKKYVEPYIDALCNDIEQTVGFARSRGIRLRNVYFGGGTPTSLSAAQLDRVLSQIDFVPDEFTVEAGRPDTLDEDKLSVLKSHGVQRVSVNPQSFNQSVLDAIGRRHTVQDICDKYLLAKEFGFVVNMDLIAGLPTETYDMFGYSVDRAIELGADNITVHTLALKRGSMLKEQNYSSAADVEQMVEYAHKRLYQSGYVPYYMYRQKYVSGNLENVGFCKPGMPCLYNIGIMEEISDILACGTNAISKRIISGENRIERAANAKDVITYIEHNEDYLQKKFKLFE